MPANFVFSIDQVQISAITEKEVLYKILNATEDDTYHINVNPEANKHQCK